MSYTHIHADSNCQYEKQIVKKQFSLIIANSIYLKPTTGNNMEQ